MVGFHGFSGFPHLHQMTGGYQTLFSPRICPNQLVYSIEWPASLSCSLVKSLTHLVSHTLVACHVVGSVCQMANLASSWLLEHGTGSLRGKDQQLLRQTLLKDPFLVERSESPCWDRCKSSPRNVVM